MSRFAAAMGGGLDAIYDALGEPAVIQSAEGYRQDCIAIPERDLTRYGDAAEVSGKTAVISVRKSEVPDRPRRGETITLTESCETLTIAEVIQSDEFEHRFLAA